MQNLENTTIPYSLQAIILLYTYKNYKKLLIIDSEDM